MGSISGYGTSEPITPGTGRPARGYFVYLVDLDNGDYIYADHSTLSKEVRMWIGTIIATPDAIRKEE